MKKPHLLPIIILFFTSTLIAQSLERELIGAAGGNNTDDQILLAWTLGEPFTTFNNVSSGTFKEGFLQPYNWNLNLEDPGVENVYTFSDKISAKVFPNPFKETFTFQISQARKTDTQLSVLDYSGKVLLKKILPSGSLKTEWTMKNYPSGLYLLQFSDDSENFLHRFKMLKL